MKRHEFLGNFIKTKQTEDVSYKQAINCLIMVTVLIPTFCLLEVISYFVYLYKVKAFNCGLTVFFHLSFVVSSLEKYFGRGC